MSKLNIQTIRKMKMYRHRELLEIYEAQIKQLTNLITARNKQLDHITQAFLKEDLRQTQEFSLKISRAGDDALDSPLELGQRYRSGPEFYVVKAVPDDFLAVVRESDGAQVVTGKDLQTMSKVFYFDYPAAILV